MSRAARAIALLKSPAVVYLGAALLSRVGGFLLVPLYTRRLTLEEYGEYALFLTLLTFLSTFLSLGLVGAITKFYFSSADRDDGRARAAEVARWVIAVCLTSGTILAITVWTLAPDAGVALWSRSTLLLAIVGGLGVAIGPIPSVLLRAEQRPYAAASFQLVQFATTIGAGLLFVLVLDRGYRGAIEAAAAGQAIAGLLAIAYVTALPRGAMSAATLRRALRFAVPFVPHFIAAWLQGAADRWIMNGAGYEAELGEYSLATQVASPVSMLVLAYNDSVGPTLGEHYRRGGLPEVRANLRGVRLRFLAAVLGVGGVLVLALPAIALLVGEDFRSGLLLVPFVLLTLVPDPALYSADYHVVYYAGRTRVLGGATVIAALVNVALNLLLIPATGAWGAIAARFCAGATRAGIVHWAARTVRESEASR